MTTQAQTQAQPEQNRSVVLNAKRRKKAEGRKKRSAKLKTDREFAKTFFEAKSKRAGEKKSAFRKKKSRKK